MADKQLCAYCENPAEHLDGVMYTCDEHHHLHKPAPDKMDEKLYVVQITYPFPGLDESEQEFDSFVVRGKENYWQVNSELEILIKNGVVFDVDKIMSIFKDRGIYVERIEEFYLHVVDDNQ